MRYLWVVGLLFSLLVTDNALAVCERTYSMAHSGDYVPYQYIDKEGNLIGLDVDLAKEAIALMGCELTIEKLPPKRAQLFIKEGKLDLMAAASITSERHKYAHFSLPYRDEEIVMFVSRDRSEELQKLTLKTAVARNLQIGAGLGGWYGAEYGAVKDEALSKQLLLLESSTEQRIKMLIYNHLDVVVADIYVGYHHASKFGGVLKIVDLPHVLNNDSVHFMMSRVTVDGLQLDAFNQALAKYIKSDKYRNLIRKYRPPSKFK